ncbi:MAG: B12-binding domain-containing radical SAM protein, partial [Microcoleus sp.]
NEFGEYTLIQVLESLETAGTKRTLLQVPNLVIATRNGGWHSTGIQAEPVNLDNDFTRWDLIDELPSMIPIRTSVGCPYRCRYCDFIELHPRVVKRSPLSMIKEVTLAKKRGRAFFNLIDDNIFLTQDRVADLTRTILESELNIIWGGFFRVDRIDETNIQDIYDSGCRFGMCGIESADNEQLKRMQKGCHRDEIRQGIELGTAAGIKLVLTFIVGFPGETKSTIDSTINFVNGLTTINKSYSSFQIFPFYVLPSTEVDGLEYRREVGLKGRHGKWSHKTMNSDEARHEWAPYMFKSIHSLPYDYYATDCPIHWDIKKRNTTFDLRRRLTLQFMDKAPDHSIQQCFSKLHSSLLDGLSSPPGTVHWTEILADRPLQPGERMPRVRLGSG